MEAIGREEGVDEFDTRKGVVRTFLPWFPEGSQVAPVDLVWLWPLADWPARAANDVLLDDQTPVELSRAGASTGSSTSATATARPCPGWSTRRCCRPRTG